MISELNSSGGWNRGEVFAGGRHVATYASTGDTAYFDHGDWLGRERARTDVNGAVTETCQGLPVACPERSRRGDGLSCLGYDASPLHFTGKERDAESGLDYFGARYDSSTVGGFLTPDWAAAPEAVPYANLADPQSLNLYAYVMNNPVTDFDVDGHHCGATGPNGCPTPKPSQTKMASRQKHGRSRKGIARAAKGKKKLIVLVGGTAVCQVAEPCGGIEDIAAALVGAALVYEAARTLIGHVHPAKHRKGARPSTLETHEKGGARRARDRGREKGDARRAPPRRRPAGWKGPRPRYQVRTGGKTMSQRARSSHRGRKRMSPAATLAKKARSPNVSARKLFAEGRKLLNYGSGSSDHKRAIELLEQAAALGHVGARVWLGAAYDYGLGTKRDRRLALKHYRIAANAGDANAQYHVGVFYHDGTGVKRDHRIAVSWLRKAARQGLAEAKYALGLCYRYGRGVPRNPKQGFRLQLEAAQRRVLEAQFSVGVCYSRGEGVRTDPRQAFRWYLVAAKRGHKDAAHNVAYFYENGRGVRQDGERAGFWRRRARTNAEAGPAAARRQATRRANRQ